MKKEMKPSRRDFLKTTGVVAASVGLVSGLSISRSAHAQGSDVIKIGLVGCGGRGRGALEDRLDVGDNVKVVAIADAFENKAKDVASLFQARAEDGNWKGKIDLPKDRIFSGFDAYKQAIELCDQVIIATPPGFRPTHFAYAVDQGKHIFAEKPLTTDAAGFRSLMESNKKAEEKGLTVVIGLQRRHGFDYKEWVKRLHDGAIGDIACTRVYWNGGDIWYRNREAGQNEMQFQMNNWYHFNWLCGDNICEQHIHNLDVGNWILSKGDKMYHPIKAYGMGGLQARDKKEDHAGEIYDHHAVEFEYADGTRMFSQCRQIDGTWSSVSEFAHGSKGMAGTDRGCWIDRKGDKKWKYEGDSPNHFKQEHVDQADAIRNGKKMHDGWYGAISSMISVMGRLATYSGNVVTWDEAVSKGTTAFPHGKELSWDVNPPNMPDADGTYKSKVPTPGKYNPYAG